MWGLPQRGNHKEAEGEWGKGLTKLDGGMGVRRIGAKGGGGHEEHGTLDTGRVCTMEKETIGNGGRKLGKEG